MTQPSEPPYAPPPSPSPATNRLPSPAPPARARRGCGSQLLGFVGWVLTLALSAALGVAALAVIAYYGFGFTLATPGQMRQASADLAALQSQSGALATEVALARSAEAEASRELASASERLGELEARLAGFEQQAAGMAGQSATAAALAQELGENVALAATIQAEGREGQVLVSVVATVQADNVARLDDLQRRAERINRFLTRLSDLAGDLDDGTPLPAATAATAEATAAPAGPTPTATP